MNTLPSHHIESLASLLAIRRDLAVDSVDMLLNALKVNDVEGIKIALRSLGVSPQDQMVIEICALAASLHTLVEDFKFSMQRDHDRGLPSAVRRLKEVVKMNFEAADRTLERCEKQGYLYRDHREHLKGLEDALKQSGTPLPESVTEQLEALQKNVDSMQKENHEVIMAQSFQDVSQRTVNNVIQLIQGIEQQIIALTVSCTDDADITQTVREIRQQAQKCDGKKKESQEM